MLTSPRPRLFALAWPMFVEQGLRVLIGTVDTFMISHLGDDAVAGLNVAWQFIILSIIIFNFVGIGSSVVITHQLGAKDREGADKLARTAVATNFWIGLLASLLIAVFAGPMLRKAGLKPELITYALPFLTLMGGSLFLESINISISAVLRAHTHTRDAMLVVVGQNILNVIGNALLLFGLFGCPKLGVLGVAISCVLSRAFAFVALAIILARRTGVRIRIQDLLHIPTDSLKRILHIGFPAAGENLSWWLAFMVVTLLVVKQLPAGIATQSYTLQIVQWVILLNVAIGLGTEIVVGHLVGAGEYQEANRELLRNLRTGFLLAMGGAVLLATAGPYVIRGFTHDATIIATATVLFRLGLVIEPGRVFNLVVINSLRATGDARFPVLMGMCSMWGVWLPLAWLLGIKLGLGLTGVWIAMACDEWLRGLMMYRRWKQQHWMVHARQSRANAIAGVKWK